MHFANYSSNAPVTPPPPGGSPGVDKEEPKKEMTKKEQLKRAFKDYGSTVIVFHVGMSLVSLGMFYTLVSRYVVVVELTLLECIHFTLL